MALANKKEKQQDKNQQTQEEQGTVEEQDMANEAEQPSALESLQQEYDQLNDRYLRIVAEYDNYRKRSAKEKTEIYPNATAAAVEKFLPVLDNFERAQQFEQGTEDFTKGFDMIYQSFKETLEGFGITAVGEVGEPFNPELHNAVMHIEDESLGENVVSMVMQKGYVMGDRVIRYAMVQTAN